MRYENQVWERGGRDTTKDMLGFSWYSIRIITGGGGMKKRTWFKVADDEVNQEGVSADTRLGNNKVVQIENW